MINRVHCSACGKRRKPSHEKVCGTEKAHSPDCKVSKEFNLEAYKALLAKRIQDAKDLKAAEEAKADAEASAMSVEPVVTPVV